MRALTKTIFTIFFIALHLSFTTPNKVFIATGQQPQVSIDRSGTIRVIYGQGDKIYCATSDNNGLAFPNIQLVGEVKDMHLGMSRGPQVASSNHYTLVSAIDKKGTIYTFQLNHKTGKWIKTAIINDVINSAPEGLMSIAADTNDNFYAVWLDTRNDHQNKIYFSASIDKGLTWSKNSMAYSSPDKTVCECCKPNIYATQSNVYITFRNWLGGSRDLYLLQSDNKGTHFDKPQKLGNGTWKLNGCPMDGGGLVVDEHTGIHTVWQREGKIFYSQPQKDEEQIGTGRNCDIATPTDPIITWQDGNKLKIKELNKGKTYHVGEGSFMKALRTTDNKILCVWESEGEIVFKTL